MALADIITAIKSHADKEVSAIQDRAMREKDEKKKVVDEELLEFESDLKKQTEEKKKQLKRKAETMVEMERRKALLEEKRGALDTVYSEVLQAVQKAPQAELQKLTDALQGRIKGQKGEVKKDPEGGFLFVSTNSEEDFSFPHLIQTVLRPDTELEVSSKLFT